MTKKIVTVSELREIYSESNTKLKDIKYFDTYDLSDNYLSERERKYNFFAVVYKDDVIYGVGSFMSYDYAKDSIIISYISVNDNYKNMGISKIITDLIVDKVSNDFPDFVLKWSEWSVDGWKYLRKYLVDKCEQKNVNYRDNIVGYPSKGSNSEFYKLIEESKKIIKQHE